MTFCGPFGVSAAVASPHRFGSVAWSVGAQRAPNALSLLCRSLSTTAAAHEEIHEILLHAFVADLSSRRKEPFYSLLATQDLPLVGQDKVSGQAFARRREEGLRDRGCHSAAELQPASIPTWASATAKHKETGTGEL